MTAKLLIVPLLLLLSSLLMALSWLGHLKFKQQSMVVLVLASWLVVLPQYILTVFAIRFGHDTFSGGAMATFNLCMGVVCVAVVSAFYLKEPLQPHQIVGFILLTVAMGLVAWRSTGDARDGAVENAGEASTAVETTVARGRSTEVGVPVVALGPEPHAAGAASGNGNGTATPGDEQRNGNGAGGNDNGDGNGIGNGNGDGNGIRDGNGNGNGAVVTASPPPLPSSPGPSREGARGIPGAPSPSAGPPGS